jgi:NAD(P)-dependent dehydrogenase (short-subunit alcohol dehydrogenase family)
MRVLVTGGTGGIGFETALELARRGEEVLVTGRDVARGQEAVSRLRQAAGHGRIGFLRADHATVGGNLAAADAALDRLGGLDVLVDNVGGVFETRQETADGYEATLAANFVGPVALTSRLLPALGAGPRSRCVSVVSSAFTMWKRDPFDDVQNAEGYVGISAYGHAKLLNLLWTLALARRMAESGGVANAVNPGMAWTSMTRSLTPTTVPAWRFVWPVVRFFQRRASPAKAAHAVVLLATGAVPGNGGYYESGGKPGRLPQRCADPATQERAWELGEALTVRAPTAPAR